MPYAIRKQDCQLCETYCNEDQRKAMIDGKNYHDYCIKWHWCEEMDCKLCVLNLFRKKVI